MRRCANDIFGYCNGEPEWTEQPIIQRLEVGGKVNKTPIEWVKNPDGTQGYTWNPITGCLNHVNGMCKGGGFPCYAYRLANGRLRQRYLGNGNLTPLDVQIAEDPEGAKGRASDPFWPRFWPERLLEVQNMPKNKGVFVCDMSDLFGIGIPEDWTRQILSEIECCDDCRFYLLTKQPQNLIKWSPFPPNCYIGVTATNSSMFADACNYLSDIEAGVKYISFEPLLGHIHIQNCTQEDLGGISWIIIGAQTKPTRLPELSAVQEIVEAADRAGIPVFLKDNLKPLIFSDPLWAEGLLNWAGELRQEVGK